MNAREFEITDQDFQSALKELHGYVDVTDEDLKEIYRRALRHACDRLAAVGLPCDRCPRLESGTSGDGATVEPKATAKPPPGVGMSEVFWSCLGALIGIGLCAWLSSRFFEPRDLTLIIGSFGASAVLVYGVVKSPLAQPRNLMGGHLISALVGVTAWLLLGSTLWLAAGVAVAVAIGAMLVTRTVHPPGGATALIAVIGGQQVHDLGFLYLLVPVGAGALVLLAVSLAVNNIPSGRSYPEYWL